MYNNYDLTFENDQTGEIKEAYKRIKKCIKRKRQLTEEDTNILLEFLKNESVEKIDIYKIIQENAQKEQAAAIKENSTNNISNQDMNVITSRTAIIINISQNMENIYDYFSQDITLVKEDLTNVNMKQLLEEYRLIKNYENDYGQYTTKETTLPVKMHVSIDELPKRIIKNRLTEKIYK